MTEIYFFGTKTFIIRQEGIKSNTIKGKVTNNDLEKSDNQQKVIISPN